MYVRRHIGTETIISVWDYIHLVIESFCFFYQIQTRISHCFCIGKGICHRIRERFCQSKGIVYVVYDFLAVCKAYSVANFGTICNSVVLSYSNASAVDFQTSRIVYMIYYVLRNFTDIPCRGTIEFAVPKHEFAGFSVSVLMILHMVRTGWVSVIKIILAGDVKLPASEVFHRYALHFIVRKAHRLGIGVA